MVNFRLYINLKYPKYVNAQLSNYMMSDNQKKIDKQAIYRIYKSQERNIDLEDSKGVT
jgi:hypothetical protein